VKVRLRWYRDPDGGNERSPGMIEVKYRVGSRRNKLRFPSNLSVSKLEKIELENPALLGTLDELRRKGIYFEDPLFPYFQISYWRHRFFDPYSGVRISVDTDITVPKYNRGMICSGLPIKLKQVVCEFKGVEGAKTWHKDKILSLGGQRSSFSKYLHCFEALTGNS